MEPEISPIPREARPFQGATAGLVTRFIANAIDVMTVSAALLVSYFGINGVLFVINPREFEFTGASLVLDLTVALLVLVLYWSTAWSITGQTYGDHVMGVRVVSRRGHLLRFPASLIRALLCVVFPIGLLWCAGGSTRRSLQDAALRTRVIYDWAPGHHPVAA